MTNKKDSRAHEVAVNARFEEGRLMQPYSSKQRDFLTQTFQIVKKKKKTLL